MALLLGYAYFVAITALSTLIQSHLVDEERGRVMALWIMGFGGTVPVGVLVGGVVIGTSTSITAVIAGRRGLGGGARRVVECAVVASQRGTGCLSHTRSPTAELRARVREVVEGVDPSALERVGAGDAEVARRTTCSRTSSASPTTS